MGLKMVVITINLFCLHDITADLAKIAMFCNASHMACNSGKAALVRKCCTAQCQFAGCTRLDFMADVLME
jgi:hypothetical protein